MDLTAPLAMAGIPIFFITTYYTDFIMVPTTHRPSVIQALLSQGYEFSAADQVYVAPTSFSHARGSSRGSLSHQNYATDPPSTPPPSSLAELQVRTFAHLRKRKVVPFVEPGLHLVQCSGKRRDDEWSERPASNGISNATHSEYPLSSWLKSIDSKLYTGLMVALANEPRFISITLTVEDAPSLLIDKRLFAMFGDSITGDADRDLVAIFLDLAKLPEGSTGIVCGVAGKLVDGLRLLGGDVGVGIELGYLSTARAGTVILSAEAAAKGIEVLKPLFEDST